MYNQYIESSAPHATASADFAAASPSKGNDSVFANLSHSLGDRLHSIQLDADTIIALAAIWFLLSDKDGLDSDLLIVIGVLLLLGV